MDARAGLGADDQLGAEPKRAAAAGRLQADDPPVIRGIGAEHQRPDQFDEPCIALRADIGLGRLALDQPLLGDLHAFQDRSVAGAVAEHADTDIDLAGPGIVVGEGDQGDQRVLRLFLQPVEHHRRIVHHESLSHQRLPGLCHYPSSTAKVRER